MMSAIHPGSSAAVSTISRPSSPESPHSRAATASPNMRMLAGPSLQLAHDEAEDQYFSASSQMSSPTHSDVENRERKEGEGEPIEAQMQNILKLFQTEKYLEVTKMSPKVETVLLGKKKELENRVKKKEARIEELTKISEKQGEEVYQGSAVYSDKEGIAESLQKLKEDLESGDANIAQEGMKELFKRHPALNTEERLPQQPKEIHKTAARLLWENAHQKMRNAKQSLEKVIGKYNRTNQKIEIKREEEIPILTKKIQEVERQKDALRLVYEKSKANLIFKTFDMTPFEDAISQLITSQTSKAESSTKKPMRARDVEFSDSDAEGSRVNYDDVHYSDSDIESSRKKMIYSDIEYSD